MSTHDVFSFHGLTERRPAHHIRLAFGADPAHGSYPHVYLCDRHDMPVVEVFEAAICQRRDWSPDVADWRAGSMAEALLRLLE